MATATDDQDDKLGKPPVSAPAGPGASPLTTCRDCGKRFRIGPLLDLPQPTRCMECLIGLEARFAEEQRRRWNLESQLSARVGMRRELETLLGVGDTYAPEEFDRGVERLRELVAAESRLDAATEVLRAVRETLLWHLQMWVRKDEVRMLGDMERIDAFLAQQGGEVSRG